MASLQEQLLKAGLSTKQKARQANSDQRKKNKQKRSGVRVGESLQEQVKADLAKAQAEKQAKDNLLNAQKKKQLQDKELHQRILQILQHHHLSNVNGDLEYNYTFASVIKKLFVDGKTHQALVNGRLALCGLGDVTYIVTAETAERLTTLKEDVILVKNERVESDDANEDDPYAEFQIPDDLMW